MRDEKQRHRVALIQHVFQLEWSIGGVDIDQHRADARRRELQHDPLGHIGGPNRHVLAVLDSQRQQPARGVIDLLGEFAIADAQVACGKGQRVVIAIAPRRFAQHLRHCQAFDPRRRVFVDFRAIAWSSSSKSEMRAIHLRNGSHIATAEGMKIINGSQAAKAGSSQ